MTHSNLNNQPPVIFSSIHYSFTTMKELKKVYGHFEIIKKNAENNISKVAYSSLEKYSKSPYLQSTLHLT